MYCSLYHRKYNSRDLCGFRDFFIFGNVSVVKSFDGEVLTLTNVQRTDMGVYLCIAKNGVPPLVSKRFEVIVHCKYQSKKF